MTHCLDHSSILILVLNSDGGARPYKINNQKKQFKFPNNQIENTVFWKPKPLYSQTETKTKTKISWKPNQNQNILELKTKTNTVIILLYHPWFR